MFNFEAGIVVEHRQNGQAEVFCNRCTNSIGTMAIGDVMRAIFNTLGRGGVLCPPCRLLTCDGCGLLQAEDVLVYTLGPRGEVKLCPKCYVSLRALDGALAEALSNDADAVILLPGLEIPQ